VLSDGGHMANLEEFENVIVLQGRDKLFTRLVTLKDESTAGQPRIAFVVGDAGSGKTCIVRALGNKAETEDTALVVVFGQCSSLANTATSFLVFKEITALLVGEGEDALSDRVISAENKLRLKKNISLVGDLIVGSSPDLLDVFIPSWVLAGNAAKYLAQKPGWLDTLKGLSKLGTETSYKQEMLYEQYARFIFGLAREIPLMVVLDDLQWADVGTLDLLFYLLRRIKKQKNLKLFLIGVYRPSDLITTGQALRHPLETIVSEAKLLFGDIIIDLSESLDAESGRVFVDGYLNSIPNRFAESFKDLLFERTQGHPLFMVETLKMLAEREHLAKDADGYWVVQKPVLTEDIPDKVEAVINERIARLRVNIREALTCASVEGEEFTAQVVARVENINEKDWLLKLSRELDRKDRLVGFVGSQRVGKLRVDRFRFRHILFQRYLYHTLTDLEKEMLHGEVGEILEELYTDNLELISNQLAHHFDMSHDNGKAAIYYRLAAEQAAKSYAYANAVQLYTRALELLPDGETLDLRFILLSGREDMLDRLGARDAQKADLDELLNLAVKSRSDYALAITYNRFARHYERTGDYPQLANYAKLALNAGEKINDASIVSESLYWYARGMSQLGQFARAKDLANRALSIAEENEDEQRKADVLTILGWIIRYYENNYALGIEYDEKAVKIYQKLGNRSREGATLNDLAVAYRDVGAYLESLSRFQSALSLMREIGSRRGEANSLQRLGTLYLYLGVYDRAYESLQQALKIREEIGDKWGLAHSYRALGGVLTVLQQISEAEEALQKALDLAKEIKSLDVEAWAHFYTGLVHEERKEWPKAQWHYEEALRIHKQSEWLARSIDDRAGLARVAVNRHELEEARLQVERIVLWLNEHGTNGLEQPVKAYSACIWTLSALNRDAEAERLLGEAHNFVMTLASKIADTSLRASFLDKLDNREIIKMWEAIQNVEM
jgi:predicted ATPase